MVEHNMHDDFFIRASTILNYQAQQGLEIKTCNGWTVQAKGRKTFT